MAPSLVGKMFTCTWFGLGWVGVATESKWGDTVVSNAAGHECSDIHAKAWTEHLPCDVWSPSLLPSFTYVLCNDFEIVSWDNMLSRCHCHLGDIYRKRHAVMCKRALHPGSLIQTSTDEIAGCSMRDIPSNCPNKAIQSQIRQVKWLDSGQFNWQSWRGCWR